MKSSVDRIAEQEFTFGCNEIQKKIAYRLDDHARILQSGAALFDASEMVTREEWRIFTQHQKVEKSLPGIQGIGFSLLIPREELTRHVQGIRREGFPEYKLKPDGERKIYSSIIYLEPFSGRNLRAFGYDMLSEPVRRTAMERARDTDTAALSGKVVLVQETDKEVQAGTLMYAPVYRKDMPIQTIEQRRAAIYGWVYSPYRMNDLMQGILGNLNLEKEKQLRIQIFDGVQTSPQGLLYETIPAGDKKLRPEVRFTRQIPVDFNGQRWTLRFTQTGGAFSTVDYIRVWLTMVGGILITLLLFALIRSLLNTRAEAQRMAENLTEELQESEERFTLAIEGNGAGLWDWDMVKDQVVYSAQWKMMLGYEVHEVEDTFSGWKNLWHPDDCANIEKAIQNYLAGETDQYEIIHRLRHKDGGWRWILTRGDIVKDAQGKPCRWVGTNLDITAQKQAAAEKAEIESQNRQLQKAESLGRMAGAIAHHFNNQLGVVIGNLEMAIDELPLDAGPIENLTTAMKASNRAAEMSSLMLTYLGQSFDKREPLDLSDACRRSLTMLQAVKPSNVVLETYLPSPGPVISTNENYIQQVMTNLITNAWEAVGESRGSVHMTVKTVTTSDIPEAHRFPIGWQPQDHAYACLEVADEGGGIADKDIEKIFDPFFSSKFTGRGMGLAVVLGIIRAHDGAITVESEPGRGSTFRVFFPAVSGEEVPRQPGNGNCGDTLRQGVPTIPSPIMPLEGRGGTVLLVEDEEMVRKMAAAMLRHLGFLVLEAKDGFEAVEVLRQRQDEIHCVLCDLTMPRMNGWETLTALRKLVPDVPVILASGYDKAHVMSGDHPEWPQVFLGKPYRLKELSDAISQAMIKKKK